MATTHSNGQVEYRPIPRFPGYEVGDDGSVWSYRKGGFGYGANAKRHQLKPNKGVKNHAGRCYLTMTLFASGKRRRLLLHRLVLEVFKGKCPEGKEGCHNDGNPENNRVDNLRWDTRKANHADRKEHGTIRKGTSHGMAKFNDEQIKEIRRLKAKGWSYRALSERYRTSIGNVVFIVQRKTWRHV